MNTVMAQALLRYGAGLIGTFLGLIFYGINLTQHWFYFTTFFLKDAWTLQLCVAGLAVLETFYVLVCMIWVYRALVVEYGHAEKLLLINWPMALHPTLLGLIISSVQIFFAWRVHVLTRETWVAWTIAVIAAFGTVAGMVFSVFTGILHPNVADQMRLKALGICWNISTNVADVMITLTLTWYLYRQRGQFSHQTDTLVNKIMKLTIQNGLMTTIWGLLNLLIFFVAPPGFFRILLISSPMIFVLGAMALLNARQEWINEQDIVPSSFISGVEQPVTGDPGLSKNSLDCALTMGISTHDQVQCLSTVKDADESVWQQNNSQAAGATTQGRLGCLG